MQLSKLRIWEAQNRSLRVELYDARLLPSVLPLRSPCS